MRRRIPFIFALAAAAPLAGVEAQRPAIDMLAETAGRREALAARIDSGVVIAYGGRALVHDFSAFFQ